MSIFCFGNVKLSTLLSTLYIHTLVILNRSGCEGDETVNETSLDLILLDMDITFDKTKLFFFPESCNLSAKLLEINVESDAESKNATALTKFFPWEIITGSNWR